MSYKIKNLREIEDVAPRFGFDSIQEARFLRRALEMQDTGAALHTIKPGARRCTPARSGRRDLRCARKQRSRIPRWRGDRAAAV